MPISHSPSLNSASYRGETEAGLSLEHRHLGPQLDVLSAHALPSTTPCFSRPCGRRRGFWGSPGMDANLGSLGSGFTVLARALSLILSHIASYLGQARWGRGFKRGKAGGKTEGGHNPHPTGTKGDICVPNRALGTHPDFVILCLVLQILIKFLLGVKLNAIHFKLLSDLEARKRSKVAKCRDNWRGQGGGR